MGNSIDYSKHPILMGQDSTTCEEGLYNSRQYVINLLNKLKRIKNFSNTVDYKKYKLYPGQQIRRYVNGTLHFHSAIYLYDGIISEMGSGPPKCKKSPVFTYNVIGLHTLKEFIKYAKKSNGIRSD